MHCLVALCLLILLAVTRPPDIPFRAHMLDPGAAETAAVADINRDGRLDIISGEHWYQAPTSTPPRTDRAAGTPGWTKHQFREVGFQNQYMDSFSVLPVDVDGDGYVDVADVSWFARRIAWWKNPGKTTTPGLWKEATVNACCNVEFAILADINNDGKAEEIVAQENGTGQSWYEVKDHAFVKHVVSDRSYGHGIGAGDVNGDGRTDILTPRGWLEAPPDPRAGNWTHHPAWESANTPATPPPAAAPPAAANPNAPPRVESLGFMHVLDVNGDGRNDVVAAAGHDYGVFWFEQGAEGRWTRRAIDMAWSQGHASTLVDLNGDGRKDLVTGKRFMAHNGSDPGEKEPLGVYWYEFRPASAAAGRGTAATARQVPASPAGGPGTAASARRAATQGVEWIRHLVDYGGRMGGGMQIPAIDVDGDGDLDLVCAGKSGLFLVENLTKQRGQGPGVRAWPLLMGDEE